MPPEPKYTKETIASLLISRSEGNVAPSSNEDRELKGAAQRIFGSWTQACEYAGLSVRKGRHLNINNLKPAYKDYDPQIELKRLAAALHIAQRAGSWDQKSVAACMDAVRSGSFDRIKILSG